ncbi:MAG: D-glycerate dehydrogenase [Candidatus Cohnella colombiensis]|uniref:Glyoxylate/hydroxypyruvate reductase B n=1 Tax=Candidatus Cohnella colombiensis TaxID=3121368 RepID=A0AA95F078_9BACL|nr:MAG: D-glycerate dehydrogenase [Cohnella sp.]
MKKFRIVMTGSTWPDAYKKLQENCVIKQWEGEGPIPRDLLLQWLNDADGLFSTNDVKVDDELLAAAPNLRVVVQSSVGYDNIDISACTRRGVPFGNTPGVLVDATADLTFGILLTAVRRIHEGWDIVKSGKWATEGVGHLFGQDMQGKTLGIVGMGAIGSAVSKRARAFGLNVLYYNRTKRSDEDILQVQYASLNQLLEKSDFVIALVPLSEHSREMFGKEQFALMKRSAYFVNAARGGIVNTEALYQALVNKEIAYAALDVTDPEPIGADHPLLTLPNILITPHIGSATYETRNRMANLSVDNLLAGLNGVAMPACVNPIQK